MKEIGILTINDYSNYGNRLQNYAVQENLKEIGVKPCTIVNKTMIEPNKDTSKMKRGLKLIGEGFINKIKQKIYFLLNKEEINNAKDSKIKNFKIFTSNYIKETDYSISVNSIPENLKDEFEYFVTGSDQVWNPSFRRFSEVDFLTFAPKEKRISFSPSIALSQIPDNLENDFKEWILGINSLSIREDVGANIIKDLTGRDAEVLLDPTMTLDKKEWVKISSESIHKPNKKYVCTYFLGETYDKYRKDIEKIAKDNNLELVNLGSLNDLKRYSIDPSEFLDYINSAELMLTDSFHGVIFSIIFNRPFVVFDRLGNLPSMQSRIDTLLSKFKLEYRNWKKINLNQNLFDIDFSHTTRILKKEKKKTMNYLTKALNV